MTTDLLLYNLHDDVLPATVLRVFGKFDMPGSFILVRAVAKMCLLVRSSLQMYPNKKVF